VKMFNAGRPSAIRTSGTLVVTSRTLYKRQIEFLLILNTHYRYENFLWKGEKEITIMRISFKSAYGLFSKLAETAFHLRKIVLLRSGDYDNSKLWSCF